MNDTDLQLIVSLIGGGLTAAEEQAARARIEGDAELRAAYEEQRSVAARLAAMPAATLTEQERAALRASLKSELHLDEAVPAPAAASRWERWRIPLGGLATAAALILAVVVIPDLIGDGETVQLADAPAALSTTAAPEPTAGADALEEGETAGPSSDGQFLAPTTTMATAERYSPTESSLMLVPLLEDLPSDLGDLERSIDEITDFTSINLDRIADCLELAGINISDVTLLGVSQSSLLGTYLDPDSGEETVVSVALPSCAVTFP